MTEKKYKQLLKHINRLFTQAENVIDDQERKQVAQDYWNIGKIVAEYSKSEGSTTKQIASDLDIPAGTLDKHVRIYKLFPDGLIFLNESGILGWSHYIAVIYVHSKKAREFYLKESARNNWSTHELRRRVRENFYENSQNARGQKGGKSNKLIERDQQLYTYSANVLKVIDGDTLKVEVDVGFSMRYETKLRLRGINCAEKGTKKGEKAKAFVEKELEGNKTPIVIKTYKSGKFGRFISDVWYLKGETDSEQILKNGKMLNQVLLDEGLAVKME